MEWIPDHRSKRINKDYAPTRLQRFSRWLHNRSLASTITKRRLTIVANCTCIALFSFVRQSIQSRQLIGFEQPDVDDAVYAFTTILILINYVSVLCACLYNLVFDKSTISLPTNQPIRCLSRFPNKSKLYHLCSLVIVVTTLVVEKELYNIHASDSATVVSIAYGRALECYRLIAFAFVCMLWLGFALIRLPIN